MNSLHWITRRNGCKHLLRWVVVAPLAGIMMLLVAVSVSAQVDFFAARTFPVGDAPSSVAVGDFNSDGRLDLATTNHSSTNVSVLLGAGDGTFRIAVNFPVGDFTHSVAVGDFNGDKRPDLATGNAASVSVLLGNGNGTFQTARAFPAGIVLRSIVASDFNRDGRQDLAATNSNSATVSVLLGNGNGTFQTARAFSTGDGPQSVTVGDFNGDNRPDLATANEISNDVSVLLGNGDGTFRTSGQTPAVDYRPLSVAVGDFNRDGRLDLATANFNDDHSVSVLLGNGDGTFRNVGRPIPVSAASSVAVGDFDRDGRLDLAMGSPFSNTVSVLLGNGDGTFQAAGNFPVGKFPLSVAVGDFNGDGRPDLATANSHSNTVSVLLNDRRAIFRSPGTLFSEFGLQGPLLSLRALSYSGTGNRDLLVASRADNILALAPGNGDGTFGTPQSFDVSGGPGPFAVADFDGNGREDVAVAKLDTGKIGVLLRNVDGVFTHFDGGLTEGSEFAVAGELRALSARDLNGDGKPDLAALTVNADGFGEVAVWLGNGDGTFAQESIVTMGMQSAALMVADVNGDGRLDLAVANQGSGNVAVALGLGDGTFSEAETFAAGAGPRALAVGHFNDDEFLDLVVANFGGNADSLLPSSVALLLGNGDGTFQEASFFGEGIRPRSLTVGDFDSDGRGDVAVSSQLFNTVAVFVGNGDGTFQEAAHFGAGSDPGEVIWDDFDGDGQRDLAVASLTAGTVSVLLNTSDWPTISSVTASPKVLWPPNHKMVAVTVSAVATDRGGAAPVCQLTGVSSNEPPNGLGDGDRAPDWQITGPLSVKLRAERAGTGSGRLYTLEVTCTDADGNTAVKITTVSVPHDKP